MNSKNKGKDNKQSENNMNDSTSGKFKMAMAFLGIFILGLFLGRALMSTHHANNDAEPDNQLNGNETIKIDDNLIMNCERDLDFNYTTQEYTKTVCSKIDTYLLEDYIKRECKGRTRGWDECEVRYIINGNMEENIWLEDKDQCRYKINNCYKSDYCEVRMHAWSDGTTSMG